MEYKHQPIDETNPLDPRGIEMLENRILSVGPKRKRHSWRRTITIIATLAIIGFMVGFVTSFFVVPWFAKLLGVGTFTGFMLTWGGPSNA